MKFYNDLRETSSEEDIWNDSDNTEKNDDYSEANDYFSTSHSEIKFNNSLSDSAQLTNEETQVIEEDLYNIVNDITEGLNDQNIMRNLLRAIHTCSTHLLHQQPQSLMHYICNFGKPDSKLHCHTRVSVKVQL